MDIFSHFLLAMLVAGFTLEPVGANYVYFVFFAGIMSIVVDFDMIFLKPLQRHPRFRDSLLARHKGASHSFVAGAGLSALGALVFTLVFHERFLLAWGVGFAFFCLHLGFDALTASRVPLLYPFTARRVRFMLDRAINYPLALASGLILLGFLVAFFVAPDAAFQARVGVVLLAAYTTYFGLRLGARVGVGRRLASSQVFVPGVSPGHYYIWERHDAPGGAETVDAAAGTAPGTEAGAGDTTFTLDKGRLFTARRDRVVHVHVPAASARARWLAAALARCKMYPYFVKWDAYFPAFPPAPREEAGGAETRVTGILFLAESYWAHRAYGLRLEVAVASGRILQEADGVFPVPRGG